MLQFLIADGSCLYCCGSEGFCFVCLICLTIGRNLFILYILCADLCKSFEVPSCVCCCKVSLSSFIQHCEQGLTWSERYSVWIYYKMAGLAEIFLLSLKRNKCKNDNNLQQDSLRTFCMLLLFRLPKLKTFKFGISQNLSSTCGINIGFGAQGKWGKF